MRRDRNPSVDTAGLGKKRRRSRRTSRTSPRRKVVRAADVSNNDSDIKAGTACASNRARPWRKTNSPRSGTTQRRHIVPSSHREKDEGNEAAKVAKHTQKDGTVSPPTDDSGKNGGADVSGDDDNADDAGASDGGVEESHGNNAEASSDAD